MNLGYACINMKLSYPKKYGLEDSIGRLIEDIIEDDLEQEREFRKEVSKYIDDKIENEIVARAIKNGTIAKA